MTADDMAEALAAATGDESLLSTGINFATRLEGDLRLDRHNQPVVASQVARAGAGIRVPFSRARPAQLRPRAWSASLK